MTHDVPHSAERLVHVNGIDIAYDTFGDPDAPPMLIITGLGVQMVFWDDAFCAQLAGRGYWVIRCDNRDSGRANGGLLPFDPVPERQRAERCYDRGTFPDGTARQLAAVHASGDRTDALRAVRVPTLVLHGRVDPFVPVECGIATAKAIPGAKLLILEQMGHRLAPAVWQDVIDAIAAHATAARATS
jgi:pimeloyl-ACP methyl ester carboxylesterase